MKDSYSILLVDDHPIFRKGILELLRQQYIYRGAEASNGLEAVQMATMYDFDLILIDERMPGMKGYDAAKKILQIKPASKIIALSQYDELPLILNFLKIGVKGYLTKDIRADLMIEALRRVRQGQYAFHSRYDDQLNEWLITGFQRSVPVIRFSRLELQIILLIAKGKTTSAVASELSITAKTAETYRYDLIKKTGLSNSAELMAYVYENGIL